MLEGGDGLLVSSLFFQVNACWLDVFLTCVFFFCHGSPNSQLSWPGGLPSMQAHPDDLDAEEEGKSEVDPGDDVISKASHAIRMKLLTVVMTRTEDGSCASAFPS